ncbi:MAG: hypothetical protein WC054_13520 [Candidatus Nanopelagicales bacterium]
MNATTKQHLVRFVVVASAAPILSIGATLAVAPAAHAGPAPEAVPTQVATPDVLPTGPEQLSAGIGGTTEAGSVPVGLLLAGVATLGALGAGGVVAARRRSAQTGR